MCPVTASRLPSVAARHAMWRAGDAVGYGESRISAETTHSLGFTKPPEAILIDPRESWEGDKAGPKDSVFLFLLQVLLAPPGVPMALPQ